MSPRTMWSRVLPCGVVLALLAACSSTTTLPGQPTTGSTGAVTGTTSGAGSTGGSAATSGGTTGGPSAPLDVMIVQDLSGSMCEPAVAGTPLEDGGDGAGDCARDQTNASKIGLVVQAMQQVLPTVTASQTAELGLTAFPDQALGGDGGACGAPPTPVVGIGPLSTNVPTVLKFYQGAVPIVNGGTPTAATLQVAASDPLLSASNGHRKAILLITDGLPNCDPLSACVVNNELWSDGEAHGCVSPDALPIVEPGVSGSPTPPADCACSYGSCPDPDGGSAGIQCCLDDPSTQTPGSLGFISAAEQCLDTTATVSEIRTLYGEGIVTYVVALGTDYSFAPATLDEMAQAGVGQSDAGHIQTDSLAALQATLSAILAPTH